MKLLAFDTSADACSVALSVDDREWLYHREEPRKHAQLLLPMIDGLVAEAGIALGDVDVVAYGCGPGSFTGVRIAVSAAQGLSLSIDANTLGLSTLAILAQAAVATTGAIDVVACLDARMSEVYVGHYRVDQVTGVVVLQAAEQVSAPEALAQYDASATFVGPGAERYEALVPGRIESGVVPTASALLVLAKASLAAGDLQPPGEAVPVYLRDKVALTEQERRDQ